MEIPQRELRNNVGEVLRRVESGERLTITVNRRPVAQLVPLPRRPRWAPVADVWDGIRGAQADAGLTRDLAELFPDTTDDVGSR